MKKPLLLFSIAFLFLISFLLGSSVPLVRAEDSLLKIRVFPDQNSVKVGMMFRVSVQLTNSSASSSTNFWAYNCSYEKHWVTDDPEVLIQPWTCEENTLEHITLDPDSVYEKSIILYVPKKDKTGPVTFRLGFQAMSEDGDIAEPLWGEPITMNVVVPEAMENAASAAGGTDQEEDTAPTTFAEVDGIPQVATPEASQAMVFQDPSVSIKVRSGDEFSISLTSNPSTGFLWKMTLPEGQKIVTFLGSEHAVSQQMMPGVPGQEVFKFKAMTQGETKADFVYKRPWETKTAPARKIFTILVQEN